MSRAGAPVVSDNACYRSVHSVPADTLVEDDRILLRDLRVLTIVGSVQHEDLGQVTFKHFNLASGDRGSLTVPARQNVKLLCEGRCFISRELDMLL